MLKRTIFLSSPLRVSVRNAQLILAPLDDNGIEPARSVPIEDLAHVVIENQRIAVTIPALNHLADHNVGVIVCDDKYMPHIMMNPLDCNTLQGQRYRNQIEASLPSKKSLWQQIITAKIKNQSLLLKKYGKDGDTLKPYYTNVKSDDSDNREGIAARLYWSMLFGPSYIRSREGASPNDLLNYGYTILRAATARAIVGAGMLPAFGIHHHNRSNAFPLADDLMEPFRSYVDDTVYGLYSSGRSSLDKESKSALIGTLYRDTMVNGKTHPMNIALEMICTSAFKVMSGETKRLNVPLFHGRHR